MQTSLLRTLVAALAILLIITLAMDIRLFSGPRIIERTVRDTIYRERTVREPVATATVPTGRYIFVTLPRNGLPADSTASATAEADSATAMPATADSIRVALPVTQRRYDDTLYTAWVSGYEPALDSIRLRLPEVTTTVTRTVVKPAPRLSVGIQAGAGYGILNRRPDIYIGVGASFRLWPN